MLDAERFVMFPEFANTLVPLADAKLKNAVDVPFVKLRFVIVPLVMTAFVKAEFRAKMFVVVTFEATRFVVVTLPKLPFQRSDEEPRERMPSTAGMRSVVMRFETARFVVAKFVLVPLVRVVAWSEVVPVAVRLEVVSPP